MIDRLVSYLSNLYQEEQLNFKWLRYGIYAALILHVLVHFGFRDSLWGDESFQTAFTGTDMPWSYLVNMGTKGWLSYPILLVIMGGGMLLDLAKLDKRIGGAIVFFGAVNLLRLEVAYATAGHHLLAILLFWNMFYPGEKKMVDFASFWGGLGLLGARVQIVLLYIVAAGVKLLGEQWINGEAFGVIAQVDEFSHPLLWSKGGGPLLVILTWCGLCYQLLFPFVIWFKRAKGLWLVIGTLFHVSIAILMGIWEFSLIMVVAYLAFVPPAWLSRFGRLLRLNRSGSK